MIIYQEPYQAPAHLPAHLLLGQQKDPLVFPHLDPQEALPLILPQMPVVIQVFFLAQVHQVQDLHLVPPVPSGQLQDPPVDLPRDHLALQLSYVQAG